MAILVHKDFLVVLGNRDLLDKLVLKASKVILVQLDRLVLWAPLVARELLELLELLDLASKALQETLERLVLLDHQDSKD